MKKKIWPRLATCFILLSHQCLQAQNVYLSLINKTDREYSNKVVSIPWNKVVALLPSVDTAKLCITDQGTQKEISFQLEYAGQAAIQNLLVQVNIKPGATIKLGLAKARPKRVPIANTYGRFVPERKEDFAWENDKIAFRMYGKELEKTPAENAYGMDVWVKRTSKLILNERYKRGEYHVDHGDGLDYYHVGFTLGAGNCMPYIADSIYYSRNYISYKILDNGPLRTSFQLNYAAWEVAGKMVTCTKTISLDAGAQLNRVAVAYNYEGTGDLPLVVGIIKRPFPGVALLDEQHGILGYWEPRHGDDGTTGVGCIIPSGVNEMKVNGKQLLAFTTVQKDKPFVYYTGAAWDKAGAITTANQWLDYLQAQQTDLVDDGIEIK